MRATVTLEGFNQQWTTGKDLVDLSVTLGHNELSSTCSVTVEDINHLKADRLIDHSLKIGGIEPLTAPNSQPLNTQSHSPIVTGSSNVKPNNRSEWEKAIVAECLRQGIKDKNQIAYILGTADHESSMGANLLEFASGDAYQGRLGNNQPGDGRRYKGRGLVQVTGKTNYQKWSKLLGVDFVKNPDLLMQPGYALTTLVVGMRDGVFTGKRLGSYINGSKVDFTGARSTVNGYVASQVASVNEKASKYQKVVDNLLASQGVATASLPTAKPTPTANQTGNDNTPVGKPLTEAPVKGNKLIVTIGETDFTFYHQETETSEQGLTTVRGQGIRWILNRRKRNTSTGQTSLFTLAQKTANAYRLRLDWQAPKDINYTFLDATWLTDYELLLRECREAGLFIGESNNTLTIKPLTAMRDTTFNVVVGLNLIKFTVQDKAIDKNAEDIGSSLLQAESKVEFDAIAGQFVPLKPDIDQKKDKTPTGKDKAQVSGVKTTESTAVANMARARVKRVKGLPSTFVVTLTQETLDLEPLDAIRTQGISKTLDRVWMVDTVKHEPLLGTTTLSCFSPIEVIDNTPTASGNAVSGNAANAKLPVTNGKFIPPVRGYVVTSPRGMRWGRMHHGYDLGTPVGVPVQASMAGVVTVANAQSGYGLVIYLKHADGYETRYAHLSKIGVRIGQQVEQGAIIGNTGNTGLGTGAHIHWEIRLNGNSLQTEQTNIGRLIKGDILR